jgi:spore germination protein
MAYLLHYGTSEPGSIAPTEWVGRIADYGRQHVPLEKLCLALHLGGFDWPNGKASGKSIEYPQAVALMQAHHAKLKHDAATGSAVFRYRDAGEAHEVWIEDAQGIQDKIRVLTAKGITQIALWRLGAGDPALWDSLTASPL